MAHIIVGNPCTFSPKTRVLITIAIIQINETRQLNIPSNEARASGAVENANIPSSEYLNSFQNDHAVVPAAR